MMEYNRLICGDAIEEMPKLPDNCVDLIVADPPYNLGKDYGNNQDTRAWHEYEAFTRNWLKQADRILKKTGTFYIFMGVRFTSRLFLILEEEMNFQFNSWITWHYTQGMGRKTGFSPRHEDILYFTKSQDFTFNLDSVRIPQIEESTTQFDSFDPRIERVPKDLPKETVSKIARQSAFLLE